MAAWTLSTPDMKRSELQAHVAQAEGVPEDVAQMINDALDTLPASRPVNIHADGRDDGEGLIEVRIAIDGRKR